MSRSTIMKELESELERVKAERDAPVDMMLWCPKCGHQHIDAPEGDWTNPPHRSHLCHNCNHIWRPAEIFTNGVLFVVCGSSDSERPKQNALQAKAELCDRMGIAVSKAINELCCDPKCHPTNAGLEAMLAELRRLQ